MGAHLRAQSAERAQEPRAAFDLEAAHIFKIYGDHIHEIEAMGFTLPLYSKSGWNPFIK